VTALREIAAGKVRRAAATTPVAAGDINGS
jgi:hypothetical protein